MVLLLGGGLPPRENRCCCNCGVGGQPPNYVHDWLQGIASIFSALRAEIGMTGCWQGGSGYWMPAATVQLLWDSCRNSKTDRAGIQWVLILLSESQSPDVPRGVKHESLKWFQKICARFFWHLYDKLSQHAFDSTRVEDLMTAAKVQNKRCMATLMIVYHTEWELPLLSRLSAFMRETLTKYMGSAAWSVRPGGIIEFSDSGRLCIIDFRISWCLLQSDILGVLGIIEIRFSGRFRQDWIRTWRTYLHNWLQIFWSFFV